MSGESMARQAADGRRWTMPEPLRPLISAARSEPVMVVALAILLFLGLIMVASSSIAISERVTGAPLALFWRQAMHALIGLMLAALILQVPLTFWQRMGPWLFIGGFVLLLLVLVPGLGREVNGSTRWLVLGPFTVQVSELARLAVILYLAGYLVRHGDAVRSTAQAFLKPMLLVTAVSLLLLAQPDFGAAAVVLTVALGMMFLGGARLWQFILLAALAGLAMAVLAITSPYRMMRLTSFVDPWQDPFASGFQLTQALIAFGRGDWFGVGLGGSVQKLFYLPEAHTDFVFAVLAEEMGLVGAVAVIVLFALVVVRLLRLARRAEAQQQPFNAWLVYGIALWLALQVFINLGVSMGVLPTKGLTLPLFSYGGSSMVVTCMAFALVLRAAHEARSQGGAR